MNKESLLLYDVCLSYLMNPIKAATNRENYSIEFAQTWIFSLIEYNCYVCDVPIQESIVSDRNFSAAEKQATV